MIRGTTQPYRFQLPVDPALVKTLKITYAQRGSVLLEKYKDDCTFEGNAGRVVLTQEDTLKFKDGLILKAQIRLLCHDGCSMASKILEDEVWPILDNEVLK